MANDFKIGFTFGAKKASSFDKTFGSVNKSVGSIVKGIAGIASAYVGVSAVKGFASDSVTAAKAQVDAETKLGAVLKNVKSVQAKGPNAYKASAKALENMAGSIQKVGVIGDEVTLSGMQQLATFQLSDKEIGTLSGGMDDLLAQQKGLNASQGDAVNIANMVGKAMSGQTGALSRVGITFTDAQAKAIKTGNSMQRAQTIAEVLKDNVGGVNKAMAEQDDGKIQQAANAYGDMKEEIGKGVLPIQAKLASMVTKHLPQIQAAALKVVGAISKGVDWVLSHSDTLDKAFDTVGKVLGTVFQIAQKGYQFISGNWGTIAPIVLGIVGAIAAYNAIMGISNTITAISSGLKAIGAARAALSTGATLAEAAATKTATGAQVGMNAAILASPITWIIVGIGALIAVGVLLYKNWDTIKAKATALWAHFGKTFPAIKAVVMAPINGIIGLFNGLKQTFSGIIEFVSGVFTGNWSKAWQGVKDIFGGIFSGLGALIKAPLNAVISLVNGAISGINSIHIDLPDWVPFGWGGKSIGFSIPKIPLLAKGGIATRATLAMVGEGKEKEAIMPLSKLNSLVQSKVSEVAAPIATLLEKFLSTMEGSQSTGNITFAPRLVFNGNASKADVKAGLLESYAEFKTLMARYTADQQRTKMRK